jgi:hypothetical protein
MKSIICVFLLLLVIHVAAHAETLSATNGSDKLTITEQPCDIGPWFKEWKKATWYYQGRVFEACWRVMGNAVMTIDSAGDLGAMPMQAFKKDEAI